MTYQPCPAVGAFKELRVLSSYLQRRERAYSLAFTGPPERVVDLFSGFNK